MFIPDPDVKKALDPGSLIRICNTGKTNDLSSESQLDYPGSKTSKDIIIIHLLGNGTYN
jgi:hypothetical protein